MSQPSASRRLSPVDRLIGNLDQALRTLLPGSSRAARSNPAAGLEDGELSTAEQRHVAGLTRVNHCGEVCAQALYQGQALTARSDRVRLAMEQAAAEEVDHLAWCEQRLAELDSRPSLFNPLFYGLSLGLGATAGLLGDRVSLGFVAATEQQVGAHLRSHLRRLPEAEQRSRAIFATMLEDEERHATQALAAGGHEFPLPVRQLMSRAARLMTASTYRL